MSSKYIGIEDARKNLGPLVTAVQQGVDVVLTRNGKPAARIVRYQEDAAMLTAHTAQVTNPNQSGLITSIDLSPELRAALDTAGVEVANAGANPDGTITIDDGGTDGYVAIGEEDGWITATAYAGDDETMIYEGRSLTDLAVAVAGAAR